MAKIQQQTRRTRSSCGLTLIEMMLVVAILAILMSMAFAAIGSARKSGNQASAVASMRTISTMNQQYRTRMLSYADSLASLNAEGLVDSVIGTGTKSGYIFTYSLPAADQFGVNGDPISSGMTGDLHFFVDETGVIRYADMTPADSASQPID